jgi:hypothetical protein
VFEDFADDDLIPVPPPGWREAIAYRSEVISALADAERAARLYEIARPYAGQMVESVIVWPGAVDRYLGMLASTIGGFDQAEAHFQAALAMEAKIRSPPLVARTSFLYGRMLLARGGPGDDQKSADLLATSIDMAQRCGMAGLAAQGGRALAGR